MSEKIKPALKAEEWAEGEFDSHYGKAITNFQIDHKGRVYASSTTDDEQEIVILNEAVDAPTILPKIAALALYGQPFGFTREDVRLLHHRAVWGDPEWEELDSLAERIAALLPPEQ